VTREQLAKEAGISHGTLVDTEAKRVAEPHFSAILKPAEAPGVGPSRLV
jgi:transcriptional regulator with XRE-family HTH domain